MMQAEKAAEDLRDAHQAVAGNGSATAQRERLDESDATPLFFVAARGHHADIGGITPGSMPPDSKSVAEEGVLFDDVLLVPAKSEAVVEFTADNPGLTLFHCHQQDHMDNGFMMLFRYA